jgi:zinc protease
VLNKSSTTKRIEMKSIKIIFAICLLLSGMTVQAQSVVELKQPQSNKVVIKLMFRNGSIADPAGKQGLTYTTAQTLVKGGTKDRTAKEIQEFIYPMAVSYNALVDKEVTTFTFNVHKDWLDKFYPIL